MKIRNYLLTVFLFSVSVVFSQTGTIIIDSIVSGGVQRTFRLYVPLAYNSANAVPLVLNIHGYTSTSSQQEMYGDFRKIADTANFIIIHPQGLPVSFPGVTGAGGNTFGWSNFDPVSSPNKDLIFLSTLLDSIISKYKINLNRIYSAGMSNGGFMSYDLACFLSNRIAAIASVTGSMNFQHYLACNPLHPMPVMEIHGTSDATVAYTGTAGIIEGIDTLVKHFVDFNHCSATPIITSVPNINLLDNCTAQHYVYSGGNQNSSVELYKIIGGNHSWPGAPININTTNMDFSASKEIWRFFSQHDLTSGMDEIKTKNNNFTVYPNPTNGTFTVSSFDTHSKKITISIVDVLGKEVFFLTENNSNDMYTKQIDLKNILPGVYFIRLSTDTSLKIQKLIIQ